MVDELGCQPHVGRRRHRRQALLNLGRQPQSTDELHELGLPDAPPAGQLSTNAHPHEIADIGKKLNAGRFSFGKPELLMETLGVTPGSVTAFAIANDMDNRVKLVLDAELMNHDSLNCHPLENIATTNIARDDILRFIRSTGHEPNIIKLAGI